MSELELRNVAVCYGDRVAVADVSVQVPSGTTLAVLGPSGCGKSSLLRAVAGLEPLASGQVLLGGRDLVGVPPHRRSIGLMFQDHALFAHLSVAANVGFGPRMAGCAKPEIARRVDEMLAMVGLPDRGGDHVAELSGGEQQRVALARTLAADPAAILLDEPLGSLDRVLRRDLTATLSAAFAATNATVVYVTHDRDEAFALGHRVAVMRAGRIEQVATPEELRAAPAGPWVAEFLRD